MRNASFPNKTGRKPQKGSAAHEKARQTPFSNSLLKLIHSLSQKIYEKSFLLMPQCGRRQWQRARRSHRTRSPRRDSKFGSLLCNASIAYFSNKFNQNIIVLGKKGGRVVSLYWKTSKSPTALLPSHTKTAGSRPAVFSCQSELSPPPRCTGARPPYWVPWCKFHRKPPARRWRSPYRSNPGPGSPCRSR